MANDRMLLICRVCYPDDGSPGMDYTRGGIFYLAKWYPGVPWYSNRLDNASFNEFLEAHDHEGFNQPFWFRYEKQEK